MSRISALEFVAFVFAVSVMFTAMFSQTPVLNSLA